MVTAPGLANGDVRVTILAKIVGAVTFCNIDLQGKTGDFTYRIKGPVQMFYR
jgi:hypothetical protein